VKKIPTVFERDWDGNPSLVLNKVTPGCEWVLAGEGIATQKYDGTSCLIRDGKLYKRRELRPGDKEPLNFEKADFDERTGKTAGWVPVGEGPEDKWHRLAFNTTVDGTYELLGPKIQNNPEKAEVHVLLRHLEASRFPEAPREFEALKVWLNDKDIEGLVFHHPDGRMAKIKLKDFGLKRIKAS
jgi:hypothetical protein